MLEGVFQIAVLRVCLAVSAALLAALALVGLRKAGRLLLRRLKPVALAALLPLAALLTDFAGEKGTNMPQRVVQPGASQAFSYCGAVTNAEWLARGAYEDWFRIPATNWWVRTADGWLDGVTVFAWCEFRPDIRTTNAFPRPFPQKLSIAPLANWHLLASGEALAAGHESLFWHGVTGSNTLVMTWQDGLYARCATNLVSFQAELFNDGSVAYRYGGPPAATNGFVVPLELPFDRDGDGLENSVDPDPLVAGPDAHGTNAEWYNTVCSNVLAAADGGGAMGPSCPTLAWRGGVNSNAYYFVDIVAEKGPAPIRFTGDRTSRLGNPAVVALAGETNRVPLLIGVDYAVTSDTPFSVSFPVDYMYPEVETNEPCVARIRWPLDFSVMPDGNGYMVVASPYDPGCEFQWPMPTRSVTCGYTTSGGWIGFDCGSDGNCGCDGCSVMGSATLEDAEFEIPSIWCGCWRDDPENPGCGPGTPQTNGPSVCVSFDKSVIFYEDAYTNAPGDVVAKRSTKTILSVSASAGENGGMLYVAAENIGKLVRTGGNAITFPYMAYVPPHGGASFAIEYEATEHSGSENDISVTASLQSAETGTPTSDSASATAVKLEFTPDYMIEGCLHRHRLGVRESAKCSWLPATVAITCEAGTGGYVKEGIGTWSYTAPLTAGDYPYLTAACGDFRHTFSLDVIKPQAIVVRSTNAFDYGVPPNVAGGAGMELELVVSPTNVSFMGIAVQEEPSDYHDPQGYFANSYFDVVWSHTTNRGAGVWHRIQADNIFMYDYAEMGDQLPRMTPTGEITDDCTYGWIAGFMNWMIPVGWNETATDETVSPVRQICVYWQRFRMASDGTLEVEKLGNVVQRGTNSVVRLNGELVPLRPR